MKHRVACTMRGRKKPFHLPAHCCNCSILSCTFVSEEQKQMCIKISPTVPTNISSPFISFPVPFFLIFSMLLYVWWKVSKLYLFFFFFLPEGEQSENAPKILNGSGGSLKWVSLSATDCCSSTPQSCILQKVFSS